MGPLAWTVFALGVPALGFTLVAVGAVGAALVARRKTAVTPSALPTYSVLIACERLSPGLTRTLARGAPGALELVVAAPPDARDVRDAVAAARGAPVRFAPSEPPPEVNRKSAHLARALEHARGELVVQADDDAELSPAVLADVVAALLADARNGAAFAPVFVRAGTPWGRRAAESVMAATPQAFVVAATMTALAGGAAPMVGTLVAWRRDALAAIGGYGALFHAIGDDLHAATLLHRRGYRAALAPRAVTTDEPALDAPRFAAQLTRWIRVGLGHRPALRVAYPTLVAPWCALALLAGLSRDARALALVAALYAARVTLAGLTRAAMRVPPTPWVALHVVLGDALVLGAYLAAATRRAVLWQGRRYTLGPRGSIVASAHAEGRAP